MKEKVPASELCRFCECVCKYKIIKGILYTACNFCGGGYKIEEVDTPTISSQEANEKFQKTIPYNPELK